MKATPRLICLSIALGTSTAFGADLRDVVAHPGKYNERRVDLVGIARVPGSFYLFADIEAAAKTDYRRHFSSARTTLVGNITGRPIDNGFVLLVS
jgi:hypothetical protein